MARTFRLRHLPRLSARRFIEADSGPRWFRAVDRYEASLLDAGLSPDQVRGHDLRRPPTPISPVAWSGFHPWAYREPSRTRSRYKRLSNRWARRATRIEVRPGMDEDEPAGHLTREFFTQVWFF